eukprot:1818703-Pyramimonas_sp.AAC.1
MGLPTEADNQRLADELEAAPTFPSQERMVCSGKGGKGGATNVTSPRLAGPPPAKRRTHATGDVNIGEGDEWDGDDYMRE